MHFGVSHLCRLELRDLIRTHFHTLCFIFLYTNELQPSIYY
uniref:Uncharacterized protein n=1 Tax=Anguilla anguilla TaxID=7936 RepID=A0A0E9PIP3_ANGAN